MSHNSEDRINDFLNSNACLWLTGAVYVLCSGLAMLSGRFAESDAGGGLFFSLDLEALTGGDRMASWAANTVLVLAVAWATTLLNKIYTPVRAVTRLYASMFLLLQAALPAVGAQLATGTLLCAVAVGLQFLLFASYERQGECQRGIYITFALLAACCLFHWAFAALMVAYAIGYLQMRSMSVQGVVAMLLGVVTPLWIGLGLGLIDPTTATPPSLPTSWTLTPAAPVRLTLAVIGAVAVLTVTLMVVNSFTIHNYRRQLRVYNYFFSTLSVVALLMMVADHQQSGLAYVPLLNWCLAMQLAHAFTINTMVLRRYVLIIALIVAALAVWAAQMLAL